MDLNEIGVTPRKEAQFKKRGIESVEDLLRCYPKEYRDYRVPVSVRTLKDRQDERAAVLGIVTGCRILQGKHAMVRLKDKDGGNISAVWFNQAFRVRQVVLGGSYIVGGTARWDEQYQSVSFLMPDLFESFEGFRFGIKPVYRKIPGMSEEYFSSVMEEALSHIDDMGDYLSDEECKELDIPSTADTFRLAHLPESMEDVERAQRRVLVDNMYPFCREMEMKRMQAAAESPFVPLAAFEAMEQIRAFLLYQLTEDQKNALRRMLHEMKTGKRLDVLLQGDVGCGKTIVAIILAACMCKSGYQTAVVCPTSVLAGQHLQAFQSLLGKLDIKVAYLQGGMKAAERKALLKEIKSGAAGVVIGTHALFSPDVEFKALGLMIIDEEHRFGVKQKEALRKKAAQGVHSVSMSATPIPRSIAVAMYGEGTEVVNIRTLPNGRKPVKTILYSNEEKVYQSMMNQISAGHMTKCFSRKNFPRDTPRLAVGYLADESGSMSGIAINASISTGIILEDLCRRMELPCYIGGFTSSAGGLQYISYVEYGSVDAKDKYRLTGMSSRGGTPTGRAIKYMAARLKKLPAANKLLIVLTDGRSADGADALQKIIKEAKKDGVTVIGAGIGESRSAVEKEFGNAFLDVSDMAKMPQLLAGVVKRHLLR